MTNLQNYIKCEDSMPEPDSDCYVLYEDGTKGMGIWLGNGWMMNVTREFPDYIDHGKAVAWKERGSDE